MLCASDLWSGNCADFVVTADKLGALYRSELQKLPDSEQSLKTTIWWGCGSGTLYDLKRLLVAIGTESAKAVLVTEPYKSLPAVELPGASMQRAPAQLTCVELPRQIERNSCIGTQLQEARTAHQLALDRCKDLVAPPLRDQLLAAESSFKAALPARCDAAADEDGTTDASLEAFNRSRCLAKALADRDRGMFEAHPECAN